MKFPTLTLLLLNSIVFSYGQNFTKYSTVQQIETTYDSMYCTKKIDKKILLSLYERSEAVDSYAMQAKISYQLSDHYTKKVVLDSALYYINVAEYLTTAFSTKEEKIEEILLKKGHILVRMGLYAFALKNLQKAYEICISKGDIELANKAKLDIGVCYSFLNRHEEARVLLTSYINSRVKNKRLIKAYNMVAITYTEENNIDSAISFYHKALQIAIKDNNIIEQAGIYLNIGIMYTLDRKFDKALEYCAIAKEKISNHNGDVYEIPNLINLTIGQSYLGLKEYAAAENHLLDSFSIIENQQVKIEVCENLVELYSKTGDLDKVILYYGKLTALFKKNKEIRNKEFITLIDRQRELIDEGYKNKELVAENNLIKAQNQKQIILISSLTLIVIISFIGLYFLNKYNQGKKTIVSLKEKEEKILREQISLRENEIGAMAIALSSRVMMLNDIKNDLHNKKELNKVIAKIQDLISSAVDVIAITDRMESQFPDFTSILNNNYPELSISDIRYCLLTKLNMSIKETANILNVSPNTVKVTRSKLKKKMNIPTEIPLKDYLEQIL